jgi:hypothetical protein
MKMSKEIPIAGARTRSAGKNCGKLRVSGCGTYALRLGRRCNAFTQRAVYLAYQTDCLPCALREQCLAPEAKGNRARRVSAVRRRLKRNGTEPQLAQ